MDEKGGSKRFLKLKFDSKTLSRRARQAETATTKHAHKFVVKKLANLREVRSNISLWILILTVLIGTVILQTIWFQQTFHKAAPANEGTYAEAVKGDIRTLNPLYASNEAELSASRLIFSSLFDYDETGHLRKNLAESIVADPARRVYTVTLRQDAKWHDGTKVTAEDVQFTTRLMRDPEARAVMQSSWSEINARTLDAKTIQFTLPGSYASFPHALTFSVLPKHILSSVEPSTLRENTFSMAPIGSGPFKLKLLQNVTTGKPHKIVHLSKNENYYKGQPRLTSFELHAYEGNPGLIDALNTRDVSAAIDVGSDDAPQGFVKETYPVNSGVYLLFNMRSGFLKNPTVRQALQKATDTKKLRQAAGEDASKGLYLPFLAHQLDSQVGLPAEPQYNISTATRLLSRAGWKKNAQGTLTNKNQVFHLRVVFNKENNYRPMLDELARQWKELGIELEIVEVDSNSGEQSFAKTVLQPRDYDILVNELALGADPDGFAYWHSSQANPLGLNFSNYQSSIADDILLSARFRAERSLRDEKYKDFANQWLRDVPAIGVYQSLVAVIHSKQVDAVVKGSILPSLTDRYSNILYWSSESKNVYKTP
ncbi:MAG TPA: peptide ABC transporter substrate-binding protein [Candidatus Saccharimonadales bacterium]